MDAREAAQTLRERRDYLIKRAAAKAGIGWDNRYDIREATALTWRSIAGSSRWFRLPTPRARLRR